MQLYVIDEIIKRGLQDSEKKYEDYAKEAKLRVWDSIEKPKRKPGWYLGFALAMAAAVSFFLVAVFLFLKLQSKQEELIALKENTTTQTKPEKQTHESIPQNEAIESENQPIVMNEQVPELKKQKIIFEKQTQIKMVGLEDVAAEMSPRIAFQDYAIAELNVPDIEVPEIKTVELETVLPSPEKNKVVYQSGPIPKKTAKIRFRIGNREPSYNANKSLALTIKL